MDNYGVLCLIPVVFVIITAIITRRTYEPLIGGAVIGFIIVAKGGFLGRTIEALYAVLSNSSVQFLIILFACFGALIELFERTRCAIGFGNVMAAKIVKNRPTSIIATWIMGIVVFADDYLNALAVSVSMRNITDRYKISREYLAYCIASTGASVCAVLPFATWAAYMMGLLGDTGLIGDLTPFDAYVKSIPFILYAWISIIIVPFMAFNLIPIVKPLKKCEERVAALPDNIADVYEQHAKIEAVKEEYDNAEIKAESLDVKEEKTGGALMFIIPIVALAGVSVYTGDMVTGTIIGLVITIIFVLAKRIMTPTEVGDACIEGTKSMNLGIIILFSSFFFQEANNALGLTPYVIEKVEPLLTPDIFPFVTFVAISALAFGTGAFWAVAAIAFPIILPLAAALDANIFVASGALASAVVFGSHACFYGDCATIVCISTEIKNDEYGRSVSVQFLIPFALAAIGFLILGFVF